MKHNLFGVSELTESSNTYHENTVVQIKQFDSDHESCCGQLSLQFTGHITNAKELKNELLESGINVTNNSNIEIISASILKWKENAFAKFNGQFIIAALFKTDNSLLLACDQLGIQTPLYYQINNNTFSFSNDIQKLKTLWNNSPAINLPGIHHYLYFGHTSNLIHLLEGIHILPPGHFLWNGNEPKKYYKVNFHDSSLNPNYIEHIKDLLLQSFTKGIDTNKKIGVIINGKLSNSIMASIVAKNYSHAYFFYINYQFMNEESNNKIKSYANKLSQICSVPLKEIQINSQDIADNFIYLSQRMQTPHASGTFHCYNFIFEAIKKDVDILFCDNGGAICFAEHKKYHAAKSFTQKSKNNSLFKQPFHKHRKLLKKWKGYKEHEIIIDSSRVCSKSVIRKLLLDDYNGQWYKHTVSPYILDEYYKLSLKMQWFDLKESIESNDNKVVISMAEKHDLKCHFPYLNTQFILHVLSINENNRIQPKNNLINQITQGLVDKDVLKLNNVDSQFPYKKLLREELNETLQDKLSEPRLEELGLFNILKIRNQIKRLPDKDSNEGQILWSLLSFVVWYEKIKLTHSTE